MFPKRAYYLAAFLLILLVAEFIWYQQTHQQLLTWQDIEALTEMNQEHHGPEFWSNWDIVIRHADEPLVYTTLQELSSRSDPPGYLATFALYRIGDDQKANLSRLIDVAFNEENPHSMFVVDMLNRKFNQPQDNYYLVELIPLLNLDAAQRSRIESILDRFAVISPDLDEILSLTESNDSRVRLLAVKSLGAFPGDLPDEYRDAVSDRLLELLDDEDIIVRTTTIRSLARYSSQEVIDALLQAYPHEEYETKAEAILTLAAIADENTVVPIIDEAKNSEDRSIREAALEGERIIAQRKYGWWWIYAIIGLAIISVVAAALLLGIKRRIPAENP